MKEPIQVLGLSAIRELSTNVLVGIDGQTFSHSDLGASGRLCVDKIAHSYRHEKIWDAPGFSHLENSDRRDGQKFGQLSRRQSTLGTRDLIGQTLRKMATGV
jgi:hypothetical protein